MKFGGLVTSGSKASGSPGAQQDSTIIFNGECTTNFRDTGWVKWVCLFRYYGDSPLFGGHSFVFGGVKLHE